KVNSADCAFGSNNVRNGRSWHRFVTKEHSKCVPGNDVCALFGKLLTQKSGIVSYDHQVASRVAGLEVRTNGTSDGAHAGKREFIRDNRPPTRCSESNRHAHLLRACLTQMYV